ACMTARGHAAGGLREYAWTVQAAFQREMTLLEELHPFDWTGGLSDEEVRSYLTPERYSELLEVHEAAAEEFLEVFLPLGLADLQAEERALAAAHGAGTAKRDTVFREAR